LDHSINKHFNAKKNFFVVDGEGVMIALMESIGTDYTGIRRYVLEFFEEQLIDKIFFQENDYKLF